MAAPLKISNFITLCCKNKSLYAIQNLIIRNYAVGKPGSPNRLEEIEIEDEEFRVLVIPGHTKVEREKRKSRTFNKKATPPPRYKSMNVDQDWTNVWPSAETFKWSVVPFPVRQGMIEGQENDRIPPGKYANAELMKIPNFLHATPAHIKKHCALLKQFCTEWPAELQSDKEINEHFPVQIRTSDYVFDAPTPRDARARTVTVKIQLSDMQLDYHARDKMLRLVTDRYDPKTDTLTIKSDRCPLKKQNLDFCMYVLTALYYEAWKVEPWECEKEIADMERYEWDIMPSKQSILQTLSAIKQTSSVPSSLHDLPDDISENTVASISAVQTYSEATESLHNIGEDITSLDKYKHAVQTLLGLHDVQSSDQI